MNLLDAYLQRLKEIKDQDKYNILFVYSTADSIVKMEMRCWYVNGVVDSDLPPVNNSTFWWRYNKACELKKSLERV